MRSHARLAAFVVVLLALGGFLVIAQPAVVSAQGAWPSLTFTQVVDGLDRPMGITHAGDNSGRLFVIEQTGRIRIVSGGALQQAPFLDITGKVSCCGERGLLGLAFAPNYATSGRFYVNYTNTAGDTVVARYRANPPGSNQADPNSEQIVLTVDQPYANHNGGHLLFGPDGYLYIGLGDGGSAGDPQDRAQNPAELLGKMLRIDVETGNPATYTVPASNPFVGRTGYRAEIWALGLRNPWRYAFDRLTGDLYIADVGQGAWEEVNVQPAGQGSLNYGWNIMEGAHCYGATTCNQTGLTLPVAEYSHDFGCSVTGGNVYRGSAEPELSGIFFYGDYCSGRVWGLRRQGAGWQSAPLSDTGYRITAFGEDQSGELYLADYTGGVIYRVSGLNVTDRIYLPLILK